MVEAEKEQVTAAAAAVVVKIVQEEGVMNVEFVLVVIGQLLLVTLSV